MDTHGNSSAPPPRVEVVSGLVRKHNLENVYDFSWPKTPLVVFDFYFLGSVCVTVFGSDGTGLYLFSTKARPLLNFCHVLFVVRVILNTVLGQPSGLVLTSLQSDSNSEKPFFDYFQTCFDFFFDLFRFVFRFVLIISLELSVGITTSNLGVLRRP